MGVKKIFSVITLLLFSINAMAEIKDVELFNGKFKQDTTNETIGWSTQHTEKNNILPVHLIIIQHPEPVIALTDGYNSKCTDGYLVFNKSINITPKKIMLSSTYNKPFLGMQIDKSDWKLSEKVYDITINACGVEYKMSADEINALHYLQYYYPHTQSSDQQKDSE